MFDRDFDAEFSQIVSPLAAEDVELVEHYQAKMFGDEPPATDTSSIEAMISIQYCLDEAGHRRAVAKCVGRLAGISLGSEVFNGEA